MGDQVIHRNHSFTIIIIACFFIACQEVTSLKSLGERLKVLRNERGLVQQDMADFLKCRVRNYQAIEAGEVNPRLPKLIELADYFGVSVDYLLGRTENREINR